MAEVVRETQTTTGGPHQTQGYRHGKVSWGQLPPTCIDLTLRRKVYEVNAMCICMYICPSYLLSLPPSLPPSFPPSSLLPSSSPSFSPSLSCPLSLPPSLPPFLFPSSPPYLPPFLPPSLPPSLPTGHSISMPGERGSIRGWTSRNFE